MKSYLIFFAVTLLSLSFGLELSAQNGLSEEEIRNTLFKGSTAVTKNAHDSVYVSFSSMDQKVLYVLDSVLALDSKITQQIVNSRTCSLILVADYVVPAIFASRYPEPFVKYASSFFSFSERELSEKGCINFFPYPGAKAAEIGEKQYYYLCFEEMSAEPDTTFYLECIQTDYLKSFRIDTCSIGKKGVSEQYYLESHLWKNTYKGEQICTISIKEVDYKLLEDVFLFILSIRQISHYTKGEEMQVYLFLDIEQNANYKFSVYNID